MRPAGFLLGLCLLGSTARAEAPGPLPLEQTKQELKALRVDGTARSREPAPTKLADGLPAVDAPVPGAGTPVSVRLPEDRDPRSTRPKDPKENWLVDGVAQLEQQDEARRERGAQDRAPTSDRRTEAALRAGPGPRATATGLLGSNSAGSGTPSRRPVSRAVDPLAPFLQNWLSRSPGNGDPLARNVSPANSAWGRPSDSPSFRLTGEPGWVRAPDPLAVNPPPSPPPNPYLQDLARPLLPAPGDAAKPGLPAPAAAVEANGFPAAFPTLLPPVPPVENKPAPFVPADEANYFPQRKKF